MLVYIILLTLTIFCCILETYVDKVKINAVSIKTKSISTAICGAFFMAMGVMRSEKLGNDYLSYFNNYWVRSDHTDWEYYLTSFGIDNGYYLINKVIHLITDDYWVFRAILFAVLWMTLLYIFYNHSRNVAVSLLIFFGLFYINYFFNALRQGIALILCFLSYHLYSKNKKITAFLVMLCSVTVHKTAFVYFCAFIFVINWKRMIFIYEMILFPVLFLVIADPVMDYLARNYKSYEIYGQRNGGYHLLMLMLAEVFVIRYIIEKHGIDKKQCTITYNLMFLSIFSQIGALFLSIFTRINFYFTFFMCLLIPDILAALRYKKSKSFYLIILIVWFGALMIYSCLDLPYILQSM